MTTHTAPVPPRWQSPASLVALLALSWLGCAGTSQPGDDEPSDAPELAVHPLLSAGATVADALASSCTTASVRPLSIQIAEEMVCLRPTAFTRFAETSTIDFTGAAVLPYLAPSALSGLTAAAAQHALTINSGFRTIAQQYLVYNWSLTGSCKISVVAKPGQSNHETGRAVDLENYQDALSAMVAHGWTHSLPSSDPVHFDYLSAPDLRGLDITAFQTLWNRNHPSAAIAVDGSWGAATESALAASPVAGFALGPSCAGGQDLGWAQVVRADVDGDGNDELGFYTTRDGTFAWYPMTAAGQLGTRLSAAKLGTGWSVILGFDPDGDGVDQLAFYDAQSGGFAVYPATATGTLGPRQSTATLGAGWTSIVAADFDGDGKDELVFYNRATGGYAVYRANADGTLGARLTASTLNDGWSELVALDVIGDGRPELGFYDAATGSFVVYTTTAAGALGSRLSVSALSEGWSAIEPVRLASTGRPALTFYDRVTGGFAIYSLDATGQLAGRLAAYPLD